MLETIWFALWGLLWAVYFMLDGFDFGAGMLHPVLGKDDTDKRIIINTLGPVWDGNEVWLITAGGATFAAFPTTYAYMFSWLYTPLLLILFGLIIRGVAFEFRGKAESETWKKVWDTCIFLGSFVPALLFGVAFGNIFEGLLIDANNVYRGNLFSLLNPYGLLTGVLFVALFLTHGALWLSMKTEGDLQVRAKALVPKLWIATVVIAVLFLVMTYFVTPLFNNFFDMPAFLLVPVIAVAALLALGILFKKSSFLAFIASCLTIVMVTFTGVIGLFPNLLPSKIDPAYSLTAFNTSSSEYTLTIMTVVVVLFVPVVIAYQVWTYYVFRHSVRPEDVTDPDVEAY